MFRIFKNKNNIKINFIYNYIMINNNINHVSGINKKYSTNYIMSSNNTVFNSGKYLGKTFKDVYDNHPEYVNFISTHKYLKNPIFFSFNEYINKRI